tara:strand:- start:99 stop:413 length:315 start_codon:yes stop_codon:yes gene_type:complete
MKYREKFIYRVMDKKEWDDFKKDKRFYGNTFDLESGFIHLSTKSQIKDTINRYFQDQKNIVILQICEKKIKENIKWEISRNNQLFPHLYGFLELFDVKKVDNIY